MALKYMLVLCLLFVLLGGSAGCKPGFPSGPPVDATPFSIDYDTNCPLESVNMAWAPSMNGLGLELRTNIQDCESGPAKASVFFQSEMFPYNMDVVQGHTHYFAYSMMWPAAETNCVVDLTATNGTDSFLSFDMVDQNGIHNTGMENISNYAENTWYQRRFIINMTLLDNIEKFRFGFTCATTWLQPVGLLAYFDNIEFGLLGAEENSSILYSSRLNCTNCARQFVDIADVFPPRDAVCNNEQVWVVNRTIREEDMAFRDHFIIHGDLITSNLTLFGDGLSVQVRGCLLPFDEAKGIAISVQSSAIIYYAYWCSLPLISITTDLDVLFDTNSILFYYTPAAPSTSHGPSYYYYPYLEDQYQPENSDWLVAVIVVACVLFIGGVVGLGVGLKLRANRRRLAARLDAELEDRAASKQ